MRPFAVVAGVLFFGLCVLARSQEPAPAPGTPPPASISVRSSLVLVPALVKTRKGELVHTLSADDFTLKDDGVPQQLRLEPDTDSQPLSLVVLVQTGGLGAEHLKDYRDLGAVLEAVVGNVRHRIAVMSFDSSQHLEQPFNPSLVATEDVLNTLDPGDKDAAILDGIRAAVDLLRKEPPSYRRALLLLSETRDSGSETSLDEALRSIEDTNTAIYSFGFSSTGAAFHHEGAKLPRPYVNTKYSDTPYPPGGCMSHDPDADPDAHGDRKLQALDCAGDLLPPLRVARMMFTAAKNSMQRNVPESVARLTGGEYFGFKDAHSLSRNLVTISNDVPNHYVLSFVPQTPHAGFHALELQLKSRPDLDVKARSAYWVDAEPQ